jgi:predicted 2-oxoglutarate/Fe(II)-dependent dioxygenase YbiX
MSTVPDSHLETLSQYIVELPDIIPSQLCYDLISEYGSDESWNRAAVGSGAVDSSIRNVYSMGISQPGVMERNFDVRHALDQQVFASTSRAITRYRELFSWVSIESDSGYDLLRYDEGMFYLQHVDSFKAHPRLVSCSFAINDDYEGGEFAFFDRRIIKKPARGSALLFPSNFMFPHEIMPVTHGTRYAIITWLI